MSETTNKMRDVAIYSDSLTRVRDLAADAIEAVEAQVAEAAKRHEDLAAWCAETEALVAALEKKFVTTTDKIEPAPSAVPAPRGFKKGDKVRTGGLSPFNAVVVEVREPQRENWNVTIKADRGTYKWHGPDLTLVRAADAPEAPAEDAGLVERLARIIVDTPCAANHEGQCIPPGAPVDDCDRANARAVLSDLTAESRLCAPGEVARLKDELAEANGARFLNANAVRLQKARAEAAEKELAEARAISAATAERVRNETQIATELRKDLADANGARDRLVRELSGERVERDYWKTRAEDVTKERDALRAELDALRAKPRFRTRRITEADVKEHEVAMGFLSTAEIRREKAEKFRKLGFRHRVEQSK